MQGKTTEGNCSEDSRIGKRDRRVFCKSPIEIQNFKGKHDSSRNKNETEQTQRGKKPVDI